MGLHDPVISKIVMFVLSSRLKIWRLMNRGQQRLRPLYYRDSHGIILTFAIDAPQSLDKITFKVRIALLLLYQRKPPFYAFSRSPKKSGSKRSVDSAGRKSPSCSWGASPICARQTQPTRGLSHPSKANVSPRRSTRWGTESSPP
jgi:hypothetical protein